MSAAPIQPAQLPPPQLDEPFGLYLHRLAQTHGHVDMLAAIAANRYVDSQLEQKRAMAEASRWLERFTIAGRRRGQRGPAWARRQSLWRRISTK